ncbi:class B sortase [Intestinibacillus massiliensis]|nr:class B sortase [Intestinibacillus massiliensis]
MRRVIRALLALLLAASLAYLGWWCWDGWRNRALYDDLLGEPPPVAAAPAETPPAPPATLEGLREKNPDCVAIVAIPGTALYYPVMQSEEEEGQYYLHRDFYGGQSAAGTPFLDVRCDIAKPSQNLILYGHHMRNGQMFAILKRYKEPAFRDAHPVVTLTRTGGADTYEVFSAFVLSGARTDAVDFLAQVDPADPAAAAALSRYPSGVAVQPDDALLTLVTCDYSVDGGRMAIVARKCAQDEKSLEP